MASSAASHLQAAEADHAVHHLADAEAVAEVMEGVTPVVIVNAQLQRKRDGETKR